MMDRWIAFTSAFWRFIGPWLALVTWIAWIWMGFDATAKIYAAYEVACDDRSCPNIYGDLQLLRIGVGATAIAVPWLVFLLRQDSKRRRDSALPTSGE